jgi:hypothetical protein
MIPARSVVRPGSGAAVIISADIANAVLKTLADAAGYTGGNINVVLTAEVYSSSPLISALVPGPFPSGVTVRLTVMPGGKVSGAGGAGGRGYYVSAAAPLGGQAGGTAIDASAVDGAGFTFELDNQGEIRGGGGGGSGGGGAPAPGGAFAGGGGGGGQGRIGGNGGPGGDWDSITGSAAVGGQPGSDAAPGLGGAASGFGLGYGAAYGYRGGNGGAWGSAGGAPEGLITGDPNFDGPQTGGAAGKSIDGYSNVTVLAGGTLTGPTAG